MYGKSIPGLTLAGSGRRSLEESIRLTTGSHTMSISHTDAYPAVRLAGVCGIASGVLLLATPALPAPDGITNALWLLGWLLLLLLLGFFAGIATLTRTTGDRTSWLSPVISAAAAVLVSVHLINVGIEYTANHLTSPAHEPPAPGWQCPLHARNAAVRVAVVASAAVGLAGRVLPRWLAWAGLVVALTALVNGTMLGSEAAWGFLLGIIWVFTGGIVLALRGSTTVTAPQMATAG
jgi:hypothetical protein